MTTISYRDRVVAYDSRETIGNIIHDDDCEKKTEHNGIFYFLGCSSCDEAEIISSFEGDLSISDGIDAFEGIVVQKGDVYRIVGGEGKLIKELQAPDKHFAIGSGALIALTAMDLGLSARESIKQAMKRDTCTGGKVRTFKV